MTTLGWTVMLLSVGAVLALNLFCLRRVLSLPPVEVEHLDTAPLDIDTQDTRQPD